jgi:hypothetical protein
MTTDDIGVGFMLASWSIWMVSLFAYGKMQREVARLAPPETNRPLRNLFQAMDRRRVFREHRRLFRKSTRRSFVRACEIASILLFLFGFILFILSSRIHV